MVQNVVEAKLTGEVKKNVEQHVVQFQDLPKSSWKRKCSQELMIVLKKNY